MRKYYYDFGYFFSNKDSGSIYITTEKPLDVDDIDSCVDYALEHKLINDEYANNIIYIEEFSEKEASRMGFVLNTDEDTFEKVESPEKISVILVEPGKCPKVIEIENTLEAMQEIVDGYIEEYMPFDDEVAIICNEEGKMNGAELNRAIYSDDKKMLDIIAGKFFIAYAPVESEKLLSMPKDLMKKYEDKFKCPEHFYQTDNGVVVKADDEFLQGMEKESEFYGCLIDVVEDFLDDKNVTISNPEREGNNPAIIYGSDYDKLKSAFKDVVESWTPEEEISNDRLIILLQNAMSVIRDNEAAGNLQDYCLIELGMTKEEYEFLSKDL